MTTTDLINYVLVVEDVRDERDAVRLILELEGYEVVAVASGQDALDYMRRGHTPRMILLDLKMYGTNGWEFRTAQLADPLLAAVPVVVCSGDGRLDEKAEALGIIGQLPKPIDPKALLKLVALHCGYPTQQIAKAHIEAARRLNGGDA